MRLALLITLALLFTIKGYSMTYDEIVAEPKAVLKFSARWCPPCKSLAEIFDPIAAKYPEQKVYRIDVDEHPEIAQKFGVRGIPTLMVIKNGNVTNQCSGVRPEPEIEKLFNE